MNNGTDADLEIAFKATFPDGTKRHVSVTQARNMVEGLLAKRFAGNAGYATAFLQAVSGKDSCALLGRRDCVNTVHYLQTASDDRLGEIVAKGDPGDTFTEIRIKVRFKGEATPEQKRMILDNARSTFEQAEIAPPGLATMGVLVFEGEDGPNPKKKPLEDSSRNWAIRWSGV